MSKNFKKMAAEQEPVYAKLFGNENLKGQMKINVDGEVQEEQDAPEEPEVLQDQDAESMATQGIKGAKLPRINMAFSPANYEYIATISRVKGMTMTKYINQLITKDREANAELYKRAKEFLDM